MTSVRSAESCAVSVRPSVLPPMVEVWNSASLAVRDRGDMEHRIALDRAVIAEELAVRPFRLDVAALVEIALETYSASAGTRMSLVTHLTTGSGASRRRRDDAEFVDRQPHHAGDMVDRMRADHEAHRQSACPPRRWPR